MYPLDKEGHHTLCASIHVVLLWSLVVQGTSHLNLTLSSVIPWLGRSPVGRWWPGQASTDALGEIRYVPHHLGAGVDMAAIVLPANVKAHQQGRNGLPHPVGADQI